MVDRENNHEYFERLAQKYPFKDRFRHLYVEIKAVIEQLGVQDCVMINRELLGKAVLDYFEDVDRLKVYEEIERTNVSKIYGYLTYWLVRRSPIQLCHSYIDKDSNLMHINEWVFANILVAKMLAEAHKTPDGNEEELAKLFDLIFYNLKYRVYTQKTLELAISSFICGCKL